MSALGHKRTYALRNAMSALTPKADNGRRTKYLPALPPVTTYRADSVLAGAQNTIFFQKTFFRREQICVLHFYSSRAGGPKNPIVRFRCVPVLPNPSAAQPPSRQALPSAVPPAVYRVPNLKDICSHLLCRAFSKISSGLSLLMAAAALILCTSHWSDIFPYRYARARVTSLLRLLPVCFR